MLEEIEVEWYGPYKISTVVDEFHEYEDFGVYMVTRKWGEQSDKILYIGKTYRQDFGTRLSQHNWLPEVRGTVKVRVGYLLEDRPSKKRLKDVENLLICWHVPEHNKKDIVYRGRDLRIINSKRRGPLKKIVDSDNLDWS